MSNNRYNPNTPPYHVPLGDPLCQTCRHRSKEGVACLEKNDTEHNCLWHDTFEEKVARDKKQSDLLLSSTTPESARTMIDLINEIPLKSQIDTSNHSKTQHYLGERNVIMLKLEALKRLLEIEHCTDLIVYLTKIAQGEKK